VPNIADMRIVSVVLCAVAPALAANAEYSWELAGRFGHTEQDRARRTPNSEFDSDLVSLSATHYFDPVPEGTGPLALAAFFDPRTHLSVTAGDEQISSQYSAGPNSLFSERAEEDVSDYSLRGLYLFAESKWYAGGRYARSEGERRRNFSSLSTRTGNGESSSEDENYALFAGKYFGTGATRLELTLEQATTQGEGSSTSCSFSGACFTSSFSSEESVVDTPRLGVMHVGRFRSATYALLGEYSETTLHSPDLSFNGVIFDPEPPLTYFVGAELYPVPTIGVRLGYENYDSPGGFDADTVSIGASWFVRRNVGLELTLSREDTDEYEGVDFVSVEDSPNTNRAVLRVIGRL
jgi:hypothetical protein